MEEVAFARSGTNRGGEERSSLAESVMHSNVRPLIWLLVNRIWSGESDRKGIFVEKVREVNSTADHLQGRSQVFPLVYRGVTTQWIFPTFYYVYVFLFALFFIQPSDSPNACLTVMLRAWTGLKNHNPLLSPRIVIPLLRILWTVFWALAFFLGILIITNLDIQADPIPSTVCRQSTEFWAGPSFSSILGQRSFLPKFTRKVFICSPSRIHFNV